MFHIFSEIIWYAYSDITLNVKKEIRQKTKIKQDKKNPLIIIIHIFEYCIIVHDVKYRISNSSVRFRIVAVYLICIMIESKTVKRRKKIYHNNTKLRDNVWFI